MTLLYWFLAVTLGIAAVQALIAGELIMVPIYGFFGTMSLIFASEKNKPMDS
jgi:hypothetical protein